MDVLQAVGFRKVSPRCPGPAGRGAGEIIPAVSGRGEQRLRGPPGAIKRGRRGGSAKYDRIGAGEPCSCSQGRSLSAIARRSLPAGRPPALLSRNTAAGSAAARLSTTLPVTAAISTTIFITVSPPGWGGAGQVFRTSGQRSTLIACRFWVRPQWVAAEAILTIAAGKPRIPQSWIWNDVLVRRNRRETSLAGEGSGRERD